MILLTTLVHTLSVHNVWDLPLWAWRSYESLHDDYVKRAKEGGNG